MGDSNHSIAKCDDDTELTCCARWTPILALVVVCNSTLALIRMIYKAYTVPAEAQDLPRAMWGPSLLTGLCFLFVAGLIAIMFLAHRQTGTEKLRFIRHAGFVAIALLLVFFVDMNSRELTNFPHPAAKLGMEIQPTSLLGMRWQAQLDNIAFMWKVSSYCILALGSSVPIWLLLVGYQKCCCCCGRKQGAAAEL